MNKRITAFSAAVLMIVNFTATAAAAEINISSDGKIYGEKLGYYFQLPEDVVEFISATRDSVPAGNALVEKVSVYCNPASSDKPEPRQLLFSFSIYKKMGWKAKDGLEEVLRTKDYVIACQTKNSSAFMDSYNVSVFNYCSNFFDNESKIRLFFTMPKTQPIEYKNSVFVNGKPLMGKVVSSKAVMLPFREVAEALGYKVGWRASEQLVTVDKDDFHDSFVMDSSTSYIYSGGVAAKLIDGRTYVAYGYFFLNCSVNISIDNNLNVYINSK